MTQTIIASADKLLIGTKTMSKKLVIVMQDMTPIYKLESWSFSTNSWGIELLNKEKQTKHFVPWSSIKYAFTKEIKNDSDGKTSDDS